jgi:hypothetical protein
MNETINDKANDLVKLSSRISELATFLLNDTYVSDRNKIIESLEAARSTLDSLIAQLKALNI